MRILAPANSFDRVSQSNNYHEKSSVTKKNVKALATATALYITFKAIECLAAEGVTNTMYQFMMKLMPNSLHYGYRMGFIYSWH